MLTFFFWWHLLTLKGATCEESWFWTISFQTPQKRHYLTNSEWDKKINISDKKKAPLSEFLTSPLPPLLHDKNVLFQTA